MPPRANTMLGSSPAETICWLPTGHALPQGAATVGPLETVNLLARLPLADWPVRDQAGAPTCVAQGSTACIELMLALGRKPRAFTTLSPRFVDDRLRLRRLTEPPAGCGRLPPEMSLAKLGEAARILHEEGICLGATWDDANGPDDPPPGPAAMTEAAQRKCRTAFYLDQPPGRPRMPGLARRLHAELRERRPVAIALPGFREKGSLEVDTSWTETAVKHNGQVPDMLSIHEVANGSGHAVCLVGFRPDADEHAGGYFLFRNSWGKQFGSNGDDPAQHRGPRRLPAAGYGTISASHVESACWEALSFTLEPLP